MDCNFPCHGKIGSIDPFGHMVTEYYGDWLKKGWDIRPTIAVTKAHIDLPECREAIAAGRLKPDGKILLETGQSIVSKAAIEPVWYLPEIARRFETTEANLRQSIFRMTNGMFLILLFLPSFCLLCDLSVCVHLLKSSSFLHAIFRSVLRDVP